MKYARANLRATALSVKAAWEESYKATHASNVAQYTKELKKWQETDKPEAIRLLQAAVASAKKDRDPDFYHLRNNIKSPPKPVGDLDCCSTTTKELDGLVELLDTLADDEITATQLSLAGFKDISRLLRRPC